MGSPRVLVHTRDAALGRAVAERLLHHGFGTHADADLDTLALALPANPGCLLVMQAYPDGLTWLSTSDSEQQARTVLLAATGECSSLAWHPHVLAIEEMERLPQALEAMHTAAPPLVRIPNPSHDRQAGQLLIVDDDELVTGFLSTRLEMEGYRCATAGDGEDAILQIRLRVPDLVLLDLNMPGMDGMEFLRRARKHINHAFGIIVMTGGGGERVRDQASRFGAFAVVRKPIHFPELLRLIDIQFDYRRMRTRLRES